ncbi:MAG TPA: DUF6282 family protein [Bryobacteraceae bacterium]|nr:DUF6282 family protein [Bryobacteraceae bacterium]
MRLLLALALAAQYSFAQLQGIVDIHTHGDPDSVPRKIDVLELARLARQEHMRAIVLKNHYAPTAQLAYIVRQVVPGIEVYGAITLNRSMGGVNPAAVEQAARFKGKYLRIVWMPTVDAENNVRFSKQKRPFVSVSRDGKLLPEVMEVLQILKQEDVALGTGHSSAEEDLLLAREARKMGLSKVVITHPLFAAIHMSVPQMKEAAQLGAYLEFCASPVLPTATAAERLDLADYIRAIRAVGPEHAILSSDLGQPQNPVHTEGWKLYLNLLRKAGITPGEIDLMARRNPARLLGLE